MLSNEIEICITCGRAGCSLRYKSGCPNNSSWITDSRPRSIDDSILEVIPWGSQQNKREIAVEKFASNADIETLASFTLLLERSVVLDKILDILVQFDSLTGTEFTILTGNDKTSVYRMLNRLFDYGIVTYQVTKGTVETGNKDVKRWSYAIA